MTNRPRTPQLPANCRQRERRLIEALRRRGLTVAAGWLFDARRNRMWKHGRIVARTGGENR